jgi:hypothetical protein
LRGFEYELTESPEATPVYAEFRALRKRPIGHSRGKLHDPFAGLGFYGVEFASPIVAGEAIVRLTNQRNSFTEDLLKLREAFDGNDYHFSNNGATAIAGADPGHIAVLVSPTPFRLNLGDRILIPKKDQMTDGEDRYLLRFVVEDPKTLTLEGAVTVTALSVLPQFMTVGNY